MIPSRRRKIWTKNILKRNPKTLDQIRKKFPRAKYAPLPDCQFCKGQGVDPNDKKAACICVFISAPTIRDASINL